MFNFLNTLHKIRVGFFVSIFLLICTSVLSFIICTSFLRNVNLVNRSQETINHIQELKLILKETESNIRAYALSRDSIFLIPSLHEQKAKTQSILQILSNDLMLQDMNQSNLKLLIIKIQGRFEFWQKIADDPSCFIQKDCFKESSKQANDLEMDFSTIIYQQKKLLQARNRLYVKNAEILIPIILITSLVGILISVIAYMGLQKEITNKQDNFLQLDKLKNELEAKIEQLNESNDELDRFAYIASHDLQEPLRKIISFSETLVKNHPKELNNDSKVYLGIISNASLRMKRLIEDLLNYSRLIPTSNSVTEQVNLNETVSTVLKDLELTFKEKNAKITIDDLPTIIGIKFQLNQLFLNLISNSLKYASADRSPEIHIFNSPVNTIVDDTFNPVAGIDYCQIEISDNGIGFEEKDEKEIFKIFNRLHGRNEYDGTGIGLAICKRVVENHKGYIKAHGKLNIGASFSIILPLNS